MKHTVRWWQAGLATLAGIGLAAGCDWWREYDAAFYRDSWTAAFAYGWKASDGIMSVSLPNDSNGKRRTLWLFGDTWVYNTWAPGVKVNQAAVNGEFVQMFTPRNTVGVQGIPSSLPVWTPPTPTQVTFYATDSTNNGQTIKNLTAIGANSESPPKSFAYSYAPRTDYLSSGSKTEKQQWRWPADGVVQTSSQLNIFWHELTETEADCYILFGGLPQKNIVFDETYVERIANPTAAPDAWTFGNPRFADMNIPKYTIPGVGTQQTGWQAATPTTAHF